MKKFDGRTIYIVDSLGATGGQNMLVDRGIMLREQGLTAKEVFEDLSEYAKNINYIVMANDLFHLRRGGRITAATAMVGSLLNIKPHFIFNREGKLAVIDKVKGVTKSLRSMVKYMQVTAKDLDSQVIYTAHAGGYEIMEQLLDILKTEQPNNKIKQCYIGPIIGSHTGPGTIGLAFIGSGRPDIQPK
jgi:DegV family protein with EDD domain